MSTYYESIDLLEYCNAIDSADIIKNVVSATSRDGLNENGKRSRSSSVSSSYDLPYVEEISESKHSYLDNLSMNSISGVSSGKIAGYGTFSGISGSSTSIAGGAGTYDGNNGNNGNNTSNNSHNDTHTGTKHKKSKKHQQQQLQNPNAIPGYLPVSLDQLSLINFNNFSSTNELETYATKVLLNSITSQAVEQGLDLNKLFLNGFGYGGSVGGGGGRHGGNAGNNYNLQNKSISEIALTVYNRKIQIEEIQRNELRHLEELKLREKELEKRRQEEENQRQEEEKQRQEKEEQAKKAAVEESSKNKAAGDAFTTSAISGMGVTTGIPVPAVGTGYYAPSQNSIVDGNYPAAVSNTTTQNSTAPSTAKQNPVNERTQNLLPVAAAGVANVPQLARKAEPEAELTVENYTEALTNLLKNRNLNLPQLTPQQIDAIAKNPTFQNNQLITNFLKISMKNAANASSQEQ